MKNNSFLFYLFSHYSNLILNTAIFKYFSQYLLLNTVIPVRIYYIFFFNRLFRLSPSFFLLIRVLLLLFLYP